MKADKLSRKFFEKGRSDLSVMSVVKINLQYYKLTRETFCRNPRRDIMHDVRAPFTVKESMRATATQNAELKGRRLRCVRPICVTRLTPDSLS